jgi:hypothetical protein
LILTSSILIAGMALGAGGPQDATPEVDRYEVYLITVDQGSEVWELFGHNALVILDRERGVSAAWNWGIFDFADVDFIPRFLRGTMRYQMAGMDPEGMIRAYTRDNRSVHSHQVLLTQDEARTLAEYVAWHDLPENRFYTYDYFRDNCSTRLRDALDLALGGALRAHFEDRETPRSYRWHSRRLVQVVGWVDQGLSFLLGPRGDRPITEWEAMFIPMELADLLEGFERPGPDGELRPLLGPRTVIFEADRPATPADAPSFDLGMLSMGLGFASFLLSFGLLGYMGLLGPGLRILKEFASGKGVAASLRTEPRIGPLWARILVGTMGSGWALFSGLLGSLLVLSWFTDHVFIHWNANIFQANPLALLLPFFLIPALTSVERARGGWGRGAAVLGLIVAGLSLAGALAQGFTLIRQGNGEVIALALPLNLALGLTLVGIYTSSPVSPADPEAGPAQEAAA